MTDFPDRIILVLGEQCRGNAVAGVKSLELLSVLDGEFHSHGRHPSQPALDLLMPYLGDVCLWIQAHNLAVDCIALRRLGTTGAQKQRRYQQDGSTHDSKCTISRAIVKRIGDLCAACSVSCL
jgi:hypothetical protein